MTTEPPCGPCHEPARVIDADKRQSRVLAPATRRSYSFAPARTDQIEWAMRRGVERLYLLGSGPGRGKGGDEGGWLASVASWGEAASGSEPSGDWKRASKGKSGGKREGEWPTR